MQAVKKRVPLAVLLAVAGLFALAAPVSATTAAACWGTGGYIGERHHQLGGNAGPLGCAIGPEENAYEGRPGKVQRYERGMITWSPSTGERSVQAAWVQNGRMWLDWGVTDPFHYDTWLVRVDRYGANVGQPEYRNGSPGVWANRGRVELPAYTWGDYRIVVEGCDLGGGHTCRQGWSNPVYLRIA